MAKGAFLDITNVSFKNIKLNIHKSSHRRTLLRWLFEVCHDFGYTIQTFILASAIVDRYTLRHGCSTDEYQLIGIAALLMAAKFEEKKIMPAAEYAVVTDGACQINEILNKERELLEVLDFTQDFKLPHVVPCGASFPENQVDCGHQEREHIFHCLLAAMVERHTRGTDAAYLCALAQSEMEQISEEITLKEDVRFYFEIANINRYFKGLS